MNCCKDVKDKWGTVAVDQAEAILNKSFQPPAKPARTSPVRPYHRAKPLTPPMDVSKILKEIQDKEIKQLSVLYPPDEYSPIDVKGLIRNNERTALASAAWAYCNHDWERVRFEMERYAQERATACLQNFSRQVYDAVYELLDKLTNQVLLEAIPVIPDLNVQGLLAASGHKGKNIQFQDGNK